MASIGLAPTVWRSVAVTPAIASPPPSSSVVSASLILLGRSRRLAEQVLESRNRIGEERWVPASLHGKPKWTVEPGQLVGSKPPGLSLPQADPGDTLTILNFVIERDRIPFQMHSLRQSFQPLPGRRIDQFRGIQG